MLPQPSPAEKAVIDNFAALTLNDSASMVDRTNSVNGIRKAAKAAHTRQTARWITTSSESKERPQGEAANIHSSTKNVGKTARESRQISRAHSNASASTTNKDKAPPKERKHDPPKKLAVSPSPALSKPQKCKQTAQKSQKPQQNTLTPPTAKRETKGSANEIDARAQARCQKALRRQANSRNQTQTAESSHAVYTPSVRDVRQSAKVQMDMFRGGTGRPVGEGFVGNWMDVPPVYHSL